MSSRRDELRAALLHFIALSSEHIAHAEQMRQSAIDDARHWGATDEQIESALRRESTDGGNADL